MRVTDPRDGLIRLIRNHISNRAEDTILIEIRSMLFRATFLFRRFASPILGTAWSRSIAGHRRHIKD